MKLKCLALAATVALSASAYANSSLFPQDALGSGAFFYDWNANQYCDSSKYNCPEKWLDTIKNVNAKISDNSKGKIRYIYLDAIQLNPTVIQNKPNGPYTVGGCGDTSTAITYCVSSTMDYVQQGKQSINGPDAIADMRSALDSNSSFYKIIPVVSYAPNKVLNPATVSVSTLSALAKALATIVNSSTNAPDGIGFDIENPDLSNSSSGTPSASGSIFYRDLANAIGSASPSSEKFIMISRGPHGLKNDSSLVSAIQKNTNKNVYFIFAPQIYDLCDGMGNTVTSWACPVATPFMGPSGDKDAWSSYFFTQLIPSTPNLGPQNGGETWTTWEEMAKDPNEGLPIKDMAMPYLFKSELYNTTLNNIPTQLVISGGGSSQIWTHVNLYGNNAKPIDYYSPETVTTIEDKITGQSVTKNLPSQLAELYTDKKPCRAENPDGSLGATIPNCISYSNPYHSSVAEYATTLFSAMRYYKSPNIIGVSIYPFTPYGYFDKTCPAKAKIDGNNECAGFFPEVPDGLVNGKKPKYSFWNAYIGQFANQPDIGLGQAPSSEPQAPTALPHITLPSTPTNYYVPGADGSAIATFIAPTVELNQQPIQSYAAQLLDATGSPVVKASNCSTPTAGKTGTCSFTGVPQNAGTFLLRIQGINSSGAVVTSIEAAARVSAGPAPSGPGPITDVHASLGSTSQSIDGYYKLSSSVDSISVALIDSSTGSTFKQYPNAPTSEGIHYIAFTGLSKGSYNVKVTTQNPTGTLSSTTVTINN